MFDIAYVNETDYDISPYEALIEKVFLETAKIENIDKYYEVSIIFVSKEKIQDINKNYRNIDKVTDVISFALFDEDDIIVDESLVTTLGDIFLCIDQAYVQADDYGHSKEREIGFLACHGLLHLLGYDHETSDDEKAMFQKQELILNSINLKREEEYEPS